jgi:drug/metabolite transporter (DMT)-like permease
MNRYKKAYIYIGLATLCWSTVASAFKLTLRYLQNDVFTMLFYSILFSLIFLFVTVLVRGNGRDILKNISKGMAASMLLGFINPFLYYIILFRSYSLLPGQIAQPLNYTWPVMLTLLSIFILRQKIGRMQFIGILVSFFGVLVLSTRGQMWNVSQIQLGGVLLALCSAILWALYWILNLRDTREATVKLFLNFCFGFFYIAIFLFIRQSVTFPSWKGLLGTLWIGVFEMGLTFVLWLKALEHAESTSVVSNVVYLSPFISLLFLKFIVGETLLFSSFSGLILIVIGIWVQLSNTKKLSS